MAVLQRDAARTRRALLEATERVLGTHGSAFSLDTVAREAGVSKGGLLHHFRSRDALLHGLVQQWITRFDEAVQRHLDPADDRPGRVCRAHIHAAFDEMDFAGSAWTNPPVQAALLGVPEILKGAQEAGERWQREMAGDGLHPQRVLLVSRALDGESMTQLFGGAPGHADRTALRDLLLALTEDAGPLVQL